MVKAAKPFSMANFLAQVARENTRQYKRKAPIFEIGDPADKVYYLQQGVVQITVISKQGKEAAVGIIEPHQFFGQSCLNGQVIRNSTATALQTASAIGIKKHAFLGLLTANIQFANAFMLDLLNRSERIEADLIDQLFNSNEKKLARLLLTLAHYGTDRDPAPILGDIDQRTLAIKIGTTRQHVSKFMAKFRRLGYISYNEHVEVHQSLLNAVLHDHPDK